MKISLLFGDHWLGEEAGDSDAVRASTQKYEDMVKEDKDGKRPLFRPKGFMAEERRLEKQRKLRL